MKLVCYVLTAGRPDYKDTYNILVGAFSKGGEKHDFILHSTVVDTKCPDLLEECMYRGDTDDRLKDKFGVDVATFQIFVHWLYTSELDIDLLLEAKDDKGKKKLIWPAMVDLWLYAAEIHAYELCDKLTDLMLEKFDPIHNFRGFSDPDGLIAAFNTIFGGGCDHDVDPESMIYKLFTDLFFTCVTLAVQPMNIELVSKAALLDVATSVMYRSADVKALSYGEKKMRFRSRYLICGEEVRSQASDSSEA